MPGKGVARGGGGGGEGGGGGGRVGGGGGGGVGGLQDSQRSPGSTIFLISKIPIHNRYIATREQTQKQY